jgi:hypothetical protein
MTVEMSIRRPVGAQLVPIDDPSLPLAVKLGRSGQVVSLPAMLKMGFQIVERTRGELAIMESHGIAFTGSPPPLVRWSGG